MSFGLWRVSVALVAALAGASARPAHAVIVAGAYANTSDATVNITPPANDPGFYNVGRVGSASAICLGNNGVLTASHIQLGQTTFSFPDPNDPSQLDTGTYNIVNNSGVLLTNESGMHVGSNSDLYLYKIDPTSSPYGTPNLPQLLLAQSTPAIGDTVMAIGRGTDRASTMTYWDNSAPFWQTTTQALAAHSGYLTNQPQIMRWGENTVATTNTEVNLGTTSNPAWVKTFTTLFSSGGAALPNEFQVTLGDSGGAVFSNVGGIWMLSGMIESIDLLPRQPYPTTNGQTATAAFGNSSVFADISVYRSQILELVPLVGDANGDGIVNGQDIALIASNWLATGVGQAGDVNGDGIVNGQDMALVASTWTTATSNTPPSGNGAALGQSMGVPEPATALLALLAAALLWLARGFNRAGRFSR